MAPTLAPSASIGSSTYSNLSPREQSKYHKLGTLSCMSLIINKMIGTGIFSVPATIFHYSNGNIGLFLTLFIVASIVIFCGLIIYLEYALNLPFRNGGEKNYLLRVFRKPKGFMGCVYAFQMVLLGFSSSNSYAFGKYVLYSLNSNADQPEWLVRLIGVLCISFCIFLHIKYPSKGTSLFNFLGLFKIFILLTIILIGLSVVLGLIHLDPHTSNFKHIWKFEGDQAPSFYSVSVALLEVVYSYKGWENANYVLNEVSDPYHVLTIAAPLAVLVTSVLYVLVIIAYLIVIPKDEILNSGVLIAGIFFNKIFGESLTSKVLPIMICLSNLGNVLVVSFAHSHVNKELADNNYLPYSRLFQNIDHSLLLHWFVTVMVLILPPSAESYECMVNLYIYPSTWINFFITLGLIYLKLNRQREQWGEYNNIDNYKIDRMFNYNSINEDLNGGNEGRNYEENRSMHSSDRSCNELESLVSTTIKRVASPYTCIVIFLLANIFLAFFPFIPPPPGSPALRTVIPYWCFPVVGTSVLLSGALFFYTRQWYNTWKYNKFGVGDKEVKYEEDYL